MPNGVSSLKRKADKLKNVPSKIDKLDNDELEIKVDDLEKKIKIISMKGLTTDLINRYSVINRWKYFSFDGLQNCLLFHLIIRNSGPLGFASNFEKYLDGRFATWVSRELSQEKNVNWYKLDTNFFPMYNSTYVKFKGICLKQKIVSFLYKKIINLYISYKLDEWSKDLNTDFTLRNCLFGAVKLTENADPDKYEYNGYGIGFESRSRFSWTEGNNRKNVIIFGVDDSSVHIGNRKENILVLGEGTTKGLEDATITTKAKYPINFTESVKIFVLSLH